MAKQISDFNWEKRIIIISYGKQNDELFKRKFDKTEQPWFGYDVGIFVPSAWSDSGNSGSPGKADIPPVGI